LSGIDNIHNEVRYVESNMLNLFVASINVSPSRWRRNDLAENIKYKFRFTPKLPTICINRKCSMGEGLCTFWSWWI